MPAAAVVPADSPIRQVPGTQGRETPEGKPGVYTNEPEWMKMCAVLVPAGSVVMRNVLCWHG